jgi:hypothetical protein
LILLLGRDYIILHPPNEALRKARGQAGILTGLGTRPGAPDIIIAGNGFCGFIELKAGRGKLAAEQLRFRDDCRARRIPWWLCRSLVDVESAVLTWGIVEHRRGAMRAVPAGELQGVGRAPDSARRDEPSSGSTVRGV